MNNMDSLHLSREHPKSEMRRKRAVLQLPFRMATLVKNASGVQLTYRGAGALPSLSSIGGSVDNMRGTYVGSHQGATSQQQTMLTSSGL